MKQTQTVHDLKGCANILTTKKVNVNQPFQKFLELILQTTLCWFRKQGIEVDFLRSSRLFQFLNSEQTKIHPKTNFFIQQPCVQTRNRIRFMQYSRLCKFLNNEQKNQYKKYVFVLKFQELIFCYNFVLVHGQCIGLDCVRPSKLCQNFLQIQKVIKTAEQKTGFVTLFIMSQKLVATHFNYVLFIPACLIQSIQNFKDVWFSTMVVPAKEFHVKRKNSLC